MPRLVLHTVMCEVEVAVNFMGPDCSSWGLPARSTSMRNFANSYGALHLGFVFEANMTVSRSLSCDQLHRCSLLDHGAKVDIDMYGHLSQTCVFCV